MGDKQAGTQKYAIHSDFSKTPVMNVRFNSLIIGALNTMLRLTRARHKSSDAVTVTRHQIPGVDGNQIGVRVVVPKGLSGAAPALIYYHGGAFAMTFASLHLDNAERYAEATGCITVFVEYRLAMKHPFPAGFDDAYAALCWVVENASNLGVDCSRIAVGGDSAGGALAAGVAQKSRDEKLVKLCAQLLIYPVLDYRCTTVSATEFTDVPLWNAVSNKRMWAMYLRRVDADAPPLYAAPGVGDVAGLPLTYIETAEFDPLRDEGLAFAEALEACGNAPDLNQTQGTIHGYDGTAGSEAAQESLQRRIQFLQAAFATAAADTDHPN